MVNSTEIRTHSESRSPKRQQLSEPFCRQTSACMTCRAGPARAHCSPVPTAAGQQELVCRSITHTGALQGPGPPGPVFPDLRHNRRREWELPFALFLYCTSQACRLHRDPPPLQASGGWVTSYWTDCVSWKEQQTHWQRFRDKRELIFKAEDDQKFQCWSRRRGGRCLNPAAHS